MKKIIVILLVLVMMLGLTACAEESAGGNNGDTATPSASAVQGGTTVEADGTVKTKYEVSATDIKTDKEIKPFKILVLYAQFTDKLGSQLKSSLEYLAEPLNLEFTFMEIGMDAEGAMSSVQAALVNGYDGCIGHTATEGYVKMFDEAGVPYVLAGGGAANKEQGEVFAGYPNYMGAVMVDDYVVGYEIAEGLYAHGCKNVMWNGVPMGMGAQGDNRTRGFQDAVAAHEDMTLVVENLNPYEWADGIATAAASYPELDGVGCVSLNESIYNTVEAENLIGQIMVSGIDISEGTGVAFEKGSLAYIAGGNYATEQLALAVLLNYLYDGTRMVETAAENVILNPINLYNIEDYNNYIKYLDSAVPAYTPQEIADMIHYFNDEVDGSTLNTVCTSYTLEDVMNRHADYVK